MAKFSPRKMMELAIEEMCKSIAEHRDDGKASPKVGAVLVDLSENPPPGGRLVTAHRGELRDGDHAEFTLLERKCRNRKLDDCVLFATLEPCAPQSRKFPKLGCAERIVLARIKKVWIGIQDPDPTVDRKGILYLQKNGVEVEMFDPDLQEVICKENTDFIAQAIERAASAAEESAKDVVLSPLEGAASVAFGDLSVDALEAYRTAAKIHDSVDSPRFQQRLKRQGLLQPIEDHLSPTGFGNLLFGNEPRVDLPHAGLLATIHYADNSEEVQDFDGPSVFVPDLVLKWLSNKLPNVIDRSKASRSLKNELLFELVREGIVNALVHRDYEIAGAKCQLRVFPDRIEIWSPGQPVAPITLEQLQSLNAPMLSRNPVLHYVFAAMDLAEERGLGLKSMKQKTQQAGLRLPRYSWNDPYLVLTIYPTADLPPEIADKLNDSERAGWQWLLTKGIANTPEYAKALAVDERTARRHLQRFVELDLAEVSGAGKATKYKVR